MNIGNSKAVLKVKNVEDLIPFSEVPAVVEKLTHRILDGRSVYHWHKDGRLLSDKVTRAYLKAIRIGGKLLTTEEEVKAFMRRVG